MESKNKSFWLELRQYGETEEDRRRNWNVFCLAMFRQHLDRLTFGNSGNVQKALSVKPFLDTKKVLMEVEERIGYLPELPDDPVLEPSMDFRKEVFEGDVSFSGRLLIGADFEGAEFMKAADFSGVQFLAPTKFKNARFPSTEPATQGVASFSNSRFYNAVDFTETRFPYNTKFKDVRFDGAALFRNAKFKAKEDRQGSPYGVSNFARSVFRVEADFSGSTFCAASAFYGVEFRDAAKFEVAKFQEKCDFNNASFGGTTSFASATFARPPKFFETELHEDANFSQVDWSIAERSYKRSRHIFASPEHVRELERDAGDAVRAWDRLALIMSQREKLPERHQFFRLKMRAIRERDGCCLPSIMNSLFDVTCDYGWGIRRAFLWWLGHIAAGALFLSVATAVCPADGDSSFWNILGNSALVSFANAHAFLGLASEGGYLHDARSVLGNALQLNWAFKFVGVVQAVLGPVLLFLLLLTLRNHFRLV